MDPCMSSCFRPNITCAQLGQSFVDNPLDTKRPGVGIICLYLFVEGIVFFILTLLIQVTEMPHPLAKTPTHM